jgi:hypothetical protein
VIGARGNRTSVETLGDSSVQELFASYAATQPDAVAVSVGLCLERSAALIVGALGILEAGAACHDI